MSTESPEHYYGDSVRTLFIICGFIMIISYPFFSFFISAPVPLSIIGCIALAIFGGLMNPKQKWVMVLNTIVPIIAFVIFEYAAVYTYLNLSPTKDIHIAFFWVNQLLSLLFFFAAYLATKTLRGTLIK
jgi:energy-coupling factor transporter transmembrane protein EcfT